MKKKQNVNQKNKKKKVLLATLLPISLLVAGGGIATGILLSRKDNSAKPIIAESMSATGPNIVVYNLKFTNNQPLDDRVSINILNVSGDAVKLVQNADLGRVVDKNFSVQVELDGELIKGVSEFDLQFTWSSSKSKKESFIIYGFKATFSQDQNALEIRYATGNEIYPQKGVAGSIVNNLSVFYNGTQLTPEEKVSEEVKWSITPNKIFSITGNKIAWTGDLTSQTTATVSITYKNKTASLDLTFICVEVNIKGGSTNLSGLDVTSSGLDNKSWEILTSGGHISPTISNTKYSIEMTSIDDVPTSTVPRWLECNNGVVSWNKMEIPSSYYGKNYKFKIIGTYNDPTSFIQYSAKSVEISLSLGSPSIQTNLKNISLSSGQSFDFETPISFLVGSEIVATPTWSLDYDQEVFNTVEINNGKLHISCLGEKAKESNIEITGAFGIYKSLYTISLQNKAEYSFVEHTSELNWKDGQDSQAWILNNAKGNIPPQDVTYQITASNADSGLSIDNQGIVHWTKDTPTTTFTVAATYHGYTVYAYNQQLIKKTASIIGDRIETNKLQLSIGQTGSDDAGTEAFGLKLDNTEIQSGVQYSLKDNPDWIDINANDGTLYWTNAGGSDGAGTYSFYVVATYGLYQCEQEIEVKIIANPCTIIGSRTIYSQPYIKCSEPESVVDEYTYTFQYNQQAVETVAENWTAIWINSPRGEEEITTSYSEGHYFTFNNGSLSWDNIYGQDIPPGIYNISLQYNYSATEIGTADLYIVIVDAKPVYSKPESVSSSGYIEKEINVGEGWTDDGQWNMQILGEGQEEYATVENPGLGFRFWDGGFHPEVGAFVSLQNGHITLSKDATLGEYEFGGYLTYKGQDLYYSTKWFYVTKDSEDITVAYKLKVCSDTHVGVHLNESEYIDTITTGNEGKTPIGQDYVLSFKLKDTYSEWFSGIDRNNTRLSIGGTDIYLPSHADITTIVDGSGNYTLIIPASYINNKYQHIKIDLQFEWK